MHVAERRTEINGVTERIIACIYRVSNTLGSGFLEKVYENALAIELRLDGFMFMQQHPIKVFYRNELVGEFFADLLIEDGVLVELKAARTLDAVHLATVEFLGEPPQLVTIVTRDERVRANARALGYMVTS